MTATFQQQDDHDEPTRVRVLLISPAGRLLLMKYRNAGPTGVDRPCWVTAGGGRKWNETIEQCALREIAEETGLTDVTLGPVVWYGDDNHRSREWNVVLREHFILAFSPNEALTREGWTQHERQNVLESRWWSLDDLRGSSEVIYPFGLADRLEPLLNGCYPEEIVILPPM